MPPTPISATPVPPEKGPQDENLPVLVTEEEEDLPPPAYTPIDPNTSEVFSDGRGVSPQSSPHGGGSVSGGYPPEKGATGWREDRQEDAAEWYGHELEGSVVPQHASGGRVMELPGDDGLGLGDQRASRASVSGM